MKVLIVKTSSLGDIIQAFSVLSYLRGRFDSLQIDWVVEEKFAALVANHPYINQVFSFQFSGLKKKFYSWSFWRAFFLFFKHLRRESYHYIFDLQGNCKSGLITILSRGNQKIGFSLSSVREWPNILATQVRYSIPKGTNIRYQYIHLVDCFFQKLYVEDDSINKYLYSQSFKQLRFSIGSDVKDQLHAMLQKKELKSRYKMMVCPGSKWKNKQLPMQTLCYFLHRIKELYDVSFLWIWGSDEEKKYCEEMALQFLFCSAVIDRMDLSALQYLMNEMDLVIAVDSSALHLCGTTSTPSFSVFGPTVPGIFKPLGSRHHAFWGTCPYQRSFEKTCPLLRTCSTGACMADIDVNELFLYFDRWWSDIISQDSKTY